MKRFLLILALLAAGSVFASAQIHPGMKYKELKSMYNFRDYEKSETDPYSPFWTGVASLFAPGLGQVVCGEPGRGIAFYAGSLLLYSTGSVFANSFSNNVIRDADGALVLDSDGWIQFSNKKEAVFDICMVGVTAAADIVLAIIASVDSKRVAKVKDMYYKDLVKSGLSFEASMHPSVNLVQTPDGYQPAPGVTLALKF